MAKGTALKDSSIEGIKKRKKSLIADTMDEIHNVKRGFASAGSRCVICGKEIRGNQRVRELPKDKNCQVTRVYHVRTCGPGSDNWKSFKANGKKTPVPKGQLSFTWSS